MTETEIKTKTVLPLTTVILRLDSSPANGKTKRVWRMADGRLKAKKNIVNDAAQSIRFRTIGIEEAGWQKGHNMPDHIDWIGKSGDRKCHRYLS